MKNIFIYLICLFSPCLVHAEFFNDITAVPVQGHVVSYKTGVYKENICFLYNKNKALYFIFSTDRGKTFSPEQKISDCNAYNYFLLVQQDQIIFVWSDDLDKSIKFTVCDTSGKILQAGKKIYQSHQLLLHDLYLQRTGRDFLLVFVENSADDSIVKLVRFNSAGSTIFVSDLYQGGENFSPQLVVIKKKILAVWSTINGDKESIYNSLSSDQGKKWTPGRLLTQNNYKMRDPVLYNIKSKTILIWQDDRLGNWNLGYAEFWNGSWKNFKNITSGLINTWLPQIGFFRNKIFYFWVSKADGPAKIASFSRDWRKDSNDPQTMINDTIRDFDYYSVCSADKFILISYLKNGKLFFSFLFSRPLKISLQKLSIPSNGYKIFWSANPSTVRNYAFTFSSQESFIPDLSVTEKSGENFYIYLNKENELLDYFFHLAVYDDTGTLIPGPALVINRMIPSYKADKIKDSLHDWQAVPAEKIIYNILQNKLYVKLNYLPGMDKEQILRCLYFYPIQYLNSQKQKAGNKFIQVFNQLNGNIDFNRLIEGDEIFLPEIWGNRYFLSVIDRDADKTLQQVIDKYHLQYGFMYYFIRSDLSGFVEKERTGPGDYLAVIR